MNTMPNHLEIWITLIPIIGIQIVNIIIALKTKAKTNEINDRTEVIRGHVNSSATAAVEKINALERQIESLNRFITDDKQKSALLAQAEAMRKKE